MTHEAGKGDKQRPTDHDAFAKNFETIFGKKEQPKPQPTTPKHVTK